MPIEFGVESNLSSAAKNILARPDLADRFEIVELLGEGSASIVYLARDRARGGERVALKLLVNKSVFAGETVQRFVDELSVSREIRHPNIVAAYELIEFEDTIAMTMEYVEGVDLAELVSRGALGREAIEDIFIQLCTALETLHDHGIYHRDLKLENIFLRADGVVKLGDFGLIVRRDGAKPTVPGALLLGTPAYMPPEYVAGRPYCAAGDLWEAGLVLYELATGRRRLAGKGGSEALEYLIKTDYQIPTLTLTGVPRKFVRIISRALEVEPTRRFQSAAEMRAAVMSDAGDPAEPGAVEVNARIELRDYAAIVHRSRRWRDGLSLSRVAWASGILFAAVLVTLGLLVHGGSPIVGASWRSITGALGELGAVAGGHGEPKLAAVDAPRPPPDGAQSTPAESRQLREKDYD